MNRPRAKELRHPASADPVGLTATALREARDRMRAVLLAHRNEIGHWEGELSSSALSTATAITALAQAAEGGWISAATADRLIGGGLRWLQDRVNGDGGWGDTPESMSNLSTTTLCWAALGACRPWARGFGRLEERAAWWLRRNGGETDPAQLAQAILRRYGSDRTFSVPILTHCALSGRLGQGEAAWRHVLPLPFELAALPQSLFAAVRLPVVSYALPALIAIGLVRHRRSPESNRVLRWIRTQLTPRVLQVLEGIQPENGGFLEATPLTSFVCMALIGAGEGSHRVTRRCLRFLEASVRGDGSWPIDTHLATWVTTLAVQAWGADAGGTGLALSDRDRLLDWLLGQQYTRFHPYTGAAPGGWAWTPLAGGVPDADDTAGALLALHRLSGGDPSARTAGAAEAGVRWLVSLQNRDGGIPTFCRGWGHLPFDRSSPDITAHAIRAFTVWRPRMERSLRVVADRALARAVEYLRSQQSEDGAWVPLWFGNQHDPEEQNATYGTAQVVKALAMCVAVGNAEVVPELVRGLDWLRAAQLSDGGWGGGRSGPPSVEETALAIEGLARGIAVVGGEASRGEWMRGLDRGLAWLVPRLGPDSGEKPSPIGFYFARLWYHERLYPQVFGLAALQASLELKLAGVGADGG